MRYATRSPYFPTTMPPAAVEESFAVLSKHLLTTNSTPPPPPATPSLLFPRPPASSTPAPPIPPSPALPLLPSSPSTLLQNSTNANTDNNHGFRDPSQANAQPNGRLPYGTPKPRGRVSRHRVRMDRAAEYTQGPFALDSPVQGD